MKVELSEMQINVLKVHAMQVILHIDRAEDFNNGQFTSGNYNDDYDSGCEAGQSELARDILDSLGIDYPAPELDA